MIEQTESKQIFIPQNFWCYLCRQKFTLNLRPGIDDIPCPRCGNDFCELISQFSRPFDFQPYQKPLRPRPKRLPRYTAQTVLIALAQYEQEVHTQKYREINEQDVKRLRIRVESQVEECLICGQDFKFGHQALKCPCGHIYHVQCLSQWLQYKNTCPKCRANVLANIE